ncbi:MAG TPA: hypothetical protein VNA30_05940 [Mycobacteriales bacterium]|nr:hypothetical protein [Mycobacteriales bacterium]
MYSWIWRHLPGGLAGRLLGSAVLAALAVLLLFTVVFPRLEPHLPFSDVTVDPASSSPPRPSP